MTDAQTSDAQEFLSVGRTDAQTSDAQGSVRRTSDGQGRRPQINRLKALATRPEARSGVGGASVPDLGPGDSPKTAPEAPLSGPQRPETASRRGRDAGKRPGATQRAVKQAPATPRGALTNRPIIRMPDDLWEGLAFFVGEKATSRRAATGLNARIPQTRDGRAVASAHVIRALVARLLKSREWQDVIEADVREERTGND
jgi:hypothetical protein